MDKNLIVSSDTTPAEHVFQAVAEQADEPRELFDRATTLAEYLDSLDITELTMKLEDDFELSIADEEAQTIKTVGELIDAVEAKIAARSTENAHDAAPPGP